MKIKKAFGIVMTILLSAIIIGMGFFVPKWLDNFLPSYKNQVKVLDNASFGNQVYYGQDTLAIATNPWNFYKTQNCIEISNQQRLELEHTSKQRMDLFVLTMVEANSFLYINKDNIMTAVETSRNWSDDTFINKIKVLVPPDVEENSPPPLYVVDDIFQNSLGSSYSVQSAAMTDDPEGQAVVYFKCKPAAQEENIEYKEVDSSVMQDAYSRLMSSSDNLQSQANLYLERLYVAASMCGQYQLSSALTECKLKRGNYISSRVQKATFEIIAVQNDLAMIYQLTDEYTIILYYDTLAADFVGFSIQTTS